MKKDEQYFLNLKKDIEAEKQTTNRLEGQLENHIQHIKETYGCNDVKSLQKLLEEKKEELKAAEQQLAEMKKELDEKYPQLNEL
jgi:predicted  nucleic acid-binding Zn-ribbon protein